MVERLFAALRWVDGVFDYTGASRGSINHKNTADIDVNIK